MPSDWSRRRQAHARKANAELFEGTPFRPPHQHGERAKRKGKRRAALDERESEDGSNDEDETSPLDILPYEIIPSILSLLPPRDLLLLKTTCHAFNQLIQSDALWREVYINRFVRSESDLGAEIPDYSTGGRRGDAGRLLEWSEEHGISSDGDVFGLARSCVTAGPSGQGWQKEAIHREAMLERFFYSRATTVMHNPHIDIIHHLSLFHNPSPASRKPAASATAAKSPSTTKVIGAKHRQAHRAESGGSGRAPNVVSVGMNAGVAIRGDPLIGRSMQGYVGPGQIPALDGVDRVPTAVYTAPINPPCIIWGLRSGIIVYSTLLNPPPNPGRFTGPSVSSPFEHSHTDAVRCVYMPPTLKDKALEKPLFVSGGEDGRVKMWMLDPSSRKGASSIGGSGELVCLWTSAPLNASRESPSTIIDEERAPGLIDPVVQVRYDPQSGLIIAATEHGNVWVWTMFMPRSAGVMAHRVYQGQYSEATMRGRNAPTHLEFDVEPETVKNLTPTSPAEGSEISPSLTQVRIMLHTAAESQIHRISVYLEPSGSLSHVEHATLLAPGTLPIQTIDAVLVSSPAHQSAIGLEKVLVPADFTIKVVRSAQSSSPATPDAAEEHSAPSGSSIEAACGKAAAMTEVDGSDDGGPAPTSTSHTAKNYGQPFIVAGTQDGCVLIWLWKQSGQSFSEGHARHPVKPLKRWKISEGAVTKVVASHGLVATGTFDGLLQIWDPLASPPTLLRTLRNRHSAPPTAYPTLETSASKLYSVNNIVLCTDMVVASIGNQILGWRAGSQKVKEGGKGWKGQILGKHGAGKSSPTKGFNQNEFKEDIKQTKTELKAEQDEIRAKNERDRIAKQEYAEIGFEDTEEALQYAIMMSREEDRSTADGALSQSTDEREFQEMLAEIAKMEARDGGGDVVGSSSKSVQPATESAPTRGNNASGIMTEEQELQIALEQIQAAEAREAAERRASRG